MKISSITTLLIASLFIISCGGNKETDKNVEESNVSAVPPMIFEGYQNDAGDILYLAHDPNEKMIHVRAGGKEFILNKSMDSTANYSNGEVSLSQKNGRTILKRNEEIIFEQDPKIISGKLNLGHNKDFILDCASGYSFWVNDKTGTLKTIYDKLIDDTDKAYNPIFVKVKVVDRGKTNEGPGATYSSVYDIIKIISSKKATDNDCIE